VAGSAARAAGRNRSVVASASEESLRFTKVWSRGMPRCLLGRDGYSSCVLRPWVRSPCSSSNTSGQTDSDCLPAGRGIMDSSNECVAGVVVDGIQNRQVREKAAEGLCGKSSCKHVFWRWQGLASVDELPGQDMGSFVSQRRAPSMWHGRVKACTRATSLDTAHNCLRSQASAERLHALCNALLASREWSASWEWPSM
jgi:hypothetical protein